MSRPATGRCRRLAVAVLVAGLLSACGDAPLGAAASIDGETISLDQVDAYADAACEYTRTATEMTNQPPQPISGAQLRVEVLNLLVQSVLTERLGERLGVTVPPSAAAGIPDTTRAVLDAMPAQEAADAADFIALSQRTGALQRAIGTELLADEGAGQETDAPQGVAPEQRGAAAVFAVQQDADIEVDPRLADGYAARVAAVGGGTASPGSPLSVLTSQEGGSATASDAPTFACS